MRCFLQEVVAGAMTKKLTFGSLFAGIGGLDLGLERAGMECKWQVEIDEYATRVLERHWPTVRRWGDIRTFTRQGFEDVDLIAGGDPCQENSNARQGYDAVESSLGGEFIRVVNAFRPKFVLRENPSRTHPEAPWPWFRFRSELESLGYVVLPFRLRACCVGFEHQRERLFLFGANSDAVQAGLQGHEFEEMAGASRQRVRNSTGQDRRNTAPRVCGRNHGIPNRSHRLRGLGNAVVPQVAEWIGRRIVEATANQHNDA